MPPTLGETRGPWDRSPQVDPGTRIYARCQSLELEEELLEEPDEGFDGFAGFDVELPEDEEPLSEDDEEPDPGSEEDDEEPDPESEEEAAGTLEDEPARASARLSVR